MTTKTPPTLTGVFIDHKGRVPCWTAIWRAGCLVVHFKLPSSECPVPYNSDQLAEYHAKAEEYAKENPPQIFGLV